MEDHIQFKSEALRIEGMIHRGSGPRGAVITHPHPQYGGDMYNPVVSAIEESYRIKDITTLRFNFRGVGMSEGSYGDGIGEMQDTLAAVRYLEENGIETIDLAGYSFGAWVNAGISPEAARIENMIMVSPPVAFIDFPSKHALPRLKLVVSGGRDDIAPAGKIQTLLPDWNRAAIFKIIEGADHFYSGHLDELNSILDANIT